MFKPITSSLIALAVAATLAGCAKKEEAAAPAAAAAPEATTPTMPPGETHPAPKAAAEVDLTGIAKAEGGKTVAEVFAEKEALAGKPVTFRGKVVKTNPDIMGKNWLHLQDGTGNPMQNRHDLVVTTLDEPKEGEVVTIEGVLAANRDFGAGYKYEVIVEDARVEK